MCRENEILSLSKLRLYANKLARMWNWSVPALSSRFWLDGAKAELLYNRRFDWQVPSPADGQHLISPAAILPRTIKMISGNKDWLLHTKLILLLLLSLEIMDFFLFPAKDKGLMIANENMKE